MTFSVLNLDADLYSATIYVLNRLREDISPRNLPVLRRDHERFTSYDAFGEFCATYWYEVQTARSDSDAAERCFSGSPEVRFLLCVQ